MAEGKIPTTADEADLALSEEASMRELADKKGMLYADMLRRMSSTEYTAERARMIVLAASAYVQREQMKREQKRRRRGRR